MEKIFLIFTETKNPSEIIGGHYLIKAESEDDAKSKLNPRLFNQRNLIEKIIKIYDISSLEFEDDIYQINDFMLE